MTAPRRILVLGGTGLLGEPATRSLLRAGHDVTVLTRGTRPVSAGARTLAGDRADLDALAGALRGWTFDVIVDLLAFDAADVERLFAVPGLETGRYLMISSGQVYLVAAERYPPFREEHATLELSPEPPAGTRDHREWRYGVGKREAERAARERARTRGTECVALRLPVVQGAHDGSRRLWGYLQRMRDGHPVLLPGGGRHPVRFVWAEDVGRALVRLADGPPPAGQAYNLAQPDEPTLAELLAGAAEIMGVSPRFLECSWERAEAAGLDAALSPYSGRWCSRPDPSRAEREWGFEGTPSAEWLPDVVRAHLAEPNPAPHPGYARRAAERELVRALLEGRG